MGVESSTVEIKIGVVDDGASAAIGAVTSKVEGLGAAGAMTGQKMAQATAGMAGAMNGAAAAAAAFSDRMKAAVSAYEVQAARGAKVQEFLGAQFDKFSANNPAVVAFERAAAAASQFTPEVERAGAAGVRMGAAYGEARIAMGAMTGSGRMMEMGLANIGSRLTWMAPLWEAALPVALGVGMIGLIAQMGEGVYDLYEKWFDVDGAIEKYNEKASEAAEKKFYANSGLDQLNSDLQTAAKQLDDLDKKRATSKDWYDIAMQPLRALGGEGRVLAPSPQSLREDAKGHFGMADAGRLNQAQGESDQLKLQKLEADHKNALQAIENAKLLEEAAARSGRARARIEEQAAERQAAENRSYRENYDNQLAAITNRGKKPGEQGYVTVVPNAGQSEYDQAVTSAKAKQRAADIEDARRAADEIRRLQEQAIEANLKGIALLEQKRKFEDEEWVRQHGASADAVMAIDARWYAQEKDYWQQQMDAFNRMAAAAMDAAAKQQEAQDKFAQRVNELSAESQVRGATGVARIRAEMQLELDRFDAEAKTANARPEDVARGEQAIRGSAAQQIANEQERVRQQTEELEAQARARRLSSEQSQTQAISAEYDQRLNKFNEELNRQEIGWDDYNRRVVAAGDLRDAQLADAARQSRERMAGEFSGLFRSLDHPLLALASMGDKVGGQAAAALMQRFQNHYSGSHGSGPLSADFSPHTILDRIAGTARPQTGTSTEIASGSAAARMIAVTSAHIQVGSASFGFGGGAGAPGSSGGTVGMGAIGAPGAFPVSSGTAGTTAWPGRPGTRLYDVNQNAVAIPGMAGAVPVSSGGTGGFAWQSSASVLAQAQAAPDAHAALQPQDSQEPGTSSAQSQAGGSSAMKMSVAGALGGTTASNDASQGAQMGGEIAGPAGMAAGAIVGAAVGIWQAREAARVYDLRQVRPHIAQDFQAFETGQMDYLSAYGDLQNLDVTAEHATKQMGWIGHHYYNDVIRGEIAQARGHLNQMAKAGRADFGTTAAQYDVGVDSLHRTGLAVIHQRERIIPGDQNERITRALESGAAARRLPAQAAGQWSGDIHIHTIDAKGVKQFLDQNKHLLRSALNQSYAENSGGADAGY